ncbi:hypothetical protein [Maribellus sediminis]|uniref:hypothetical protein n=1 Tax=Maribellus sediminis TaxID=2696285 RepID=UPI0014303CB9|nr:hypothetical protein [Maribellus sediminis]
MEAVVKKNFKIMATKFRKSPPLCLFISIGRLLAGKLKLSKQYLKDTVKMEDGQEFIIFRHITDYPVKNIEQAVTFIVRFKFARLSHNANRFASIIPMLLITGFPGFQTKMYAVNKNNGYWQGMYQWESMENLEEYKNSFVFKVMNKRANPESIKSTHYENKSLYTFIKEKVK